MSINIYEIVTNEIIKGLEKGEVAWQKPWKGGARPRNFKSMKPYNGINVLMLALSGGSTPYFLTYKQVQDMGGSVKAGAASTIIIHWNFSKKIDPVSGEEIQGTPFLRYFRVFNLDQTVGIEYSNPYEQIADFEKIHRCEEILAGFKDMPILTHDGQKAFYSNLEDRINMPDPKSFIDEERYYATLFHECVHATRHEKRLNREKGGDEEAYSKEELVAEIGAAMLNTIAGVEVKTFNNSVAYIQSWLQALRNDKRMILSAAAQAQKAVDYIHCEPAEEVDAPVETNTQELAAV